MRTLFTIIILIISFIKIHAQVTYNWNSFPAGGTSYANTQSGGCTMNTTVNGIQFNAGAPRFDNAVGTNGAGLFLNQNWTTTNSSTDVVSNFSPALSNPSFTIFDINRNANTSDFCSSAWTDSVFVSAVGATGVTFTQANLTQQNIVVVGSTIKIVGRAACNQPSQGSVTISFTGPVTQITIKYLSGSLVTRCSVFTPCGPSVTPPCATLMSCTNPAVQFITIGNITGSSCCTGPTGPPTSLIGNTGPFCSATTTTLSATGAFTNSQWHVGSCSSAVIATGTNLVVTPAVTTTYYVNNLDCNNNPTSCIPITVTVTPNSITPTISNTGLTVCAGKSTTLTSSSAINNQWSNGSTATSIVVSNAGTYTLAVSNAGGCLSNPASVTINTVALPPTPTVSASGSLSFCPGGSVVLSASSAASYTWSNGANTPTINVSTAGTFTVNVSNASGCSKASAIITTTLLTKPATPTITSTGLSLCTGQTTTLTSSSNTGNIWSTGQTTQTIFVSTSGNYSLTVTGANGCVSNQTIVSVNFIAPPNTPTITANGSPTFCAGNNIILSSSNSTGNTWSNGATTQTILVNSSGNYSVVTGSGSCAVNSSIFNVTVLPTPANPTITATNTNLCAGESATLTSSSAINNIWSTGATTSSIVVSTSGTYSLSLNSGACPSNIAVITITVNGVIATPTITSSGSPTFCVGNTIVLSSSNTTGNIWNTGATTQTILVTTSGNYSVTSGSGACANNSNIFIVSVLPALATPTISSNANNVCAGQTIVLTSSSSFNNLWSNGVTSQTTQVTTSGIYSLTVSNGTLCSSPIATISIVVNSSSVNVIVPPNVIACNGNMIAAINFSPTTGVTYVWQNSNSNIGLTTNGNNNIPTFTATNIGNTITEAIITVTPSVLGCNGIPNSFTIQINPNLIVNAGANDTICFGQNTSINANPNSGNYTYSWLPSTGLINTNSFNPVANPTLTTNYTLTVTDANGCFGKDDITIYSNTAFSSIITSTNNSCYNACDAKATVTAIGGQTPYSFIWNNSQTQSTVSNLCAGNYSVILKDSWNCLSTNSIAINQPLQVTASIINFTNTSCHNTCNGSALGSAIGGSGLYTFKWNTFPNQLAATAINLCAGTYTLKTTDSNNCSDSVSVIINQPSPLNLLASPNVTICFGATTSLSTSISGGSGLGYTYTWTPNLNLNNPSNSSVISTPSVNTTYTVFASDANGCLSNSVSISVYVKSPLLINASGASVCLGNSNNLSANVTGGNTTAYTYNWQPASSLSNNSIQNPIATNSITSIYTVTVNDGCSTPVSATVTLVILELPLININANINKGCAPLCISFADNSTNTASTNTTWNWNFGNQNTSSIQNPLYCFDNSGNYTISLSVTAANGCSSIKTFSNYITVYSNPMADFQTPSNLTDAYTEAQFLDQSIGANNWAWNFNDPFSSSQNNVSSLQNPFHNYTNQGLYCVNLTVTNNFGCMDSKTKCFKIEPEVTIYVPNCFTPNDDNINDVFTAVGLNIINFDLTIFDRWGEEIYHTNDMQKGWDGTAKGNSQQSKQDIYVWKINAKDIFNKEHNLLGKVTLLR